MNERTASLLLENSLPSPVFSSSSSAWSSSIVMVRRGMCELLHRHGEGAHTKYSVSRTSDLGLVHSLVIELGDELRHAGVAIRLGVSEELRNLVVGPRSGLGVGKELRELVGGSGPRPDHDPRKVLDSVLRLRVDGGLGVVVGLSADRI